MAVALDSSVIVAYLDRDDALHRQAADRVMAILGQGTIAVSVIAYAEVVTGARLGHHELDLVRGFFDQCVGRIAPVSSQLTTLVVSGASRA